MKQSSKILTLILFSSLFLNLSAQDDGFQNDPIANSGDVDRGFRFGLQVKPGISWFKPNSSGYEKEGSKVGFSYGLSTEFFLGKNYLFSTGFFITSLGGDFSYEGVYLDNNNIYVPSEVKQSTKIGYIEIPLTLKLRTNEIGYMTYYGNFGLRTAFKYKSTSDFSYIDIKNTPKIEKVNTAGDVFFFNSWLVIGAGAEYNISGNTNLSFGISYNNGFINALHTKTHLLDATTGKAALGTKGEALYTDKNASANINYFALEVGIYF
ncbi:MAG: PorT family protein [Vicingus serpentipes]|nr:PorT family protein [Vicingus serpentipes]